MLAATTGELRLAIPAWGCILLMGMGAVYLLFGARWPRFFNVLSMTVLGCALGMVISGWVPLAQPVVIIVGGLLCGGLTAFFRNVTHAVLASIVLATVLASLAALAVGKDGFTSYLVLNLSDRAFSTRISGPNLAHDPVLAAGLTGLLVGATVAIARFGFSQRLVTAVQGAGLILVGAVELITFYRGEGRPSLATEFPLTLAACLLCLVAIGLVAQQALARTAEPWEAGAAADLEDDEE